MLLLSFFTCHEDLMRVLHAGTTTETQGNLRSDDVEKPEIGNAEDEKAQTIVTRNIVFVTSEAAPYSKTGGLADVCGSLPIALAGRGHRVMVISPRYVHGTAADSKFSSAVDLASPINVFCFGGAQEVGFFHEYREGVDWVSTSFSVFFLFVLDICYFFI
jgi:starch synthase